MSDDTFTSLGDLVASEMRRREESPRIGMSFQHIGDLAAIQVKRSGDQRMIRSVYAEMKRLLALIDKIKTKPAAEQVALIRAHVAATAQEAAAEANVRG